jgi:hypothetical protein
MPGPTVQTATTRLDEQLFARDARRLQAVVSRTVYTSQANVEDACGFAWLQLVHYQPRASVAFAWLPTTAVREALKLHRWSALAVGLDQASDLSADRAVGPGGRLALIVPGDEIRAPRLRPREARLIGLRVAGYSRALIAELGGDSGGPWIGSWRERSTS